ncbi:MAG TPA: DegT/DnrJ/EryC1/StrS family aminotransferase [Chthoniobacterales bacterium]
MTPIPFFDLRRQFLDLRRDLLAEVTAVCDEQNFILGPRVRAFEEQVEQLTGATHAVGTSSGTDAELLILMSLGVGPGDAVVTTPFTFFATAACIARLGARPIFVDVDPGTLNLSVPALESFLEHHCRPAEHGLMTEGGLQVRAVIPVHVFGLCADLDGLQRACAPRGLTLIEDAAQAIGAVYPSGTGPCTAGSVGKAGFLSFYPTKNLGAFGDAGMALTSDPDLAERLRINRNHGMEPRYCHQTLGGNFRMDALQAAVLNRKLHELPRWSERRWRIAQRYHEVFEGLEALVQLPVEPYRETLGWQGHTYHQFVLRTACRDALRGFLTERGIGTEIYYPVPLHQQPCFAGISDSFGELPAAEQAAREALALPIFPELSDDEVDRIAYTVRRFFHLSDVRNKRSIKTG